MTERSRPTIQDAFEAAETSGNMVVLVSAPNQSRLIVCDHPGQPDDEKKRMFGSETDAHTGNFPTLEFNR